ncbi:hypothetical protein PHET_10241 [Paragonimus heterotremus]|uniref:Uncharacterized protein n=1 Tax=Paragonimus heterotremus TaxID=100268 RepID=A0A8J4SNI7_9TREM|nr:hypothetical protein PHET_10241 [Paragonimus heterotremus]
MLSRSAVPLILLRSCVRAFPRGFCAEAELLTADNEKNGGGPIRPIYFDAQATTPVMLCCHIT